MPNNAATKITRNDPAKKPAPLVLGLLERDNRTMIRAKLVGLTDAARARGTISKIKVTISAIYSPLIKKKRILIF